MNKLEQLSIIILAIGLIAALIISMEESNYTKPIRPAHTWHTGQTSGYVRCADRDNLSLRGARLGGFLGA